MPKYHLPESAPSIIYQDCINNLGIVFSVTVWNDLFVELYMDGRFRESYQGTMPRV